MDFRRTKEIVESLGVIEVLHNGKPVWIESVRSDSADVSYIGTDKRLEVPFDSLVEGDEVKK